MPFICVGEREVIRERVWLEHLFCGGQGRVCVNVVWETHTGIMYSVWRDRSIATIVR